jgi:WD40 repeat protein
VFIAYHPRDADYCGRLAAQLEQAGIVVWREPAADYGSNWLTAVRPMIDSCGAFIVLMTRRAEQSEWLDLQVARAIEAGVPILPILLEGQWTFKRLHIAGHQTFTRAFDGLLPRPPFLDELLVALGRAPLTPAEAAPLLRPATRTIELPASRIDTTGWSEFDLEFMAPHADLVVWSPDGGTIAVGGDDGMTYLWDVAGGFVRTAIEQAEPIRVVNWSPDGRRLVTGDDRGRVMVWDAADGSARLSVATPDGDTRLAAWSVDGACLATAQNRTGVVRLWHGDTGDPLTVLSGQRRWQVQGGAWSPTDPHRLAVLGDRRVRLWDTQAGVVRSELMPAQGWGMAWSPDGTQVAALHDDTFGIFNADSAVEQQVLVCHGYAPRGAAWSPDGGWLAVGGTDSHVRVWNPRDPRPAIDLTGHDGPVLSVSWSPDGRQLVAAGASRAPVIWDVPSAADA